MYMIKSPFYCDPKFVTKTLAVGSLAIATMFTQAYAQDNEVIVVSANRSDIALKEAPVSISVVDGDKSKLKGIDQVSLALKQEPGLRLQSDGTPGMNLVSIRGESASRTVMMIDGQRVDDQKTKSGAPLFANPFFVKQVEVIRGASSVLYGSDAQAGVVNAITYEPSKDKLAIDTGAMYNSQGRGTTEFLNLSGTLDKVSYALGAAQTDMGDRVLANHKRLDNTSYYQTMYNGLLKVQATDKFSFGIKADSFDLNAKTATTTTDKTFDGFTMNIPKWKRNKLSVFSELTRLNDYVESLKATLYKQSMDKKFSQDFPSEKLKIYVDNQQDTVGGNLQGKFNLTDILDITTGYDFKEDEIDGNSKIDMSKMVKALKMPARAKANIPTSTSSITKDAKQITHALYALTDLYATDSLKFSLGLRYDHIVSKSGDTTKENVTKARTTQSKETYANKTYSHFVSSFATVYNLDDNNTLRFNVAQGYRAPNLTQLFMTTDSGGTVSPNPNLKAETSLNYELGYRLFTENIDFDIAAFYNTIDDYIDKYANAVSMRGTTYSWRNVAKVKSYGLESKFSYTINKFKPYLNLTLMNRKFEYNHVSTHHTGTPHIFGTLGISFNDTAFDNPYYVDLNTDFASKAVDDDLGHNNYIQNDLDIKGYATLNLASGMTLDIDKVKLDVYGSFNNILDKEYRTSSYIHEAGRNFILGFRAKY